MPRRRWGVVRRKALDRDLWRCQGCGKAGRLEVHHVTPLEAGGSEFDLDNLTTLCIGCHIRVHQVEPSPEVQAWQDFTRDTPDTSRG